MHFPWSQKKKRKKKKSFLHSKFSGLGNCQFELERCWEFRRSFLRGEGTWGFPVRRAFSRFYRKALSSWAIAVFTKEQRGGTFELQGEFWGRWTPCQSSSTLSGVSEGFILLLHSSVGCMSQMNFCPTYVSGSQNQNKSKVMFISASDTFEYSLTSETMKTERCSR